MRATVSIVVFSIALAVPAGAQQRATPTVPIIARLSTALNVSALAGIQQTCSQQPRAGADACQALVIERQSELTGSRSDARHAEDLLERAALAHDRDPLVWYGLGLIRLQLARDTLFSRGGAMMPVGASYLEGAANAFVQALKLNPAFGEAADALVQVPEPREGTNALKERVGVLRRVRDVLSPASLAAAANLERDVGNVDSSLAMEDRALASGRVDSGLVSLGMARDLYAIDQPAEGRSVLLRGAEHLTAAAKAAYRTELTWVASLAELAAWDTLASANRSPWLADFWQKRDVAEGRKDNARLVEHYRRIEYAMKSFRVTLPQTGRQRMLTNEPGGNLQDEMAAHRLAMGNPTCFPYLARLASLDEMIGAHSVFRYYQPIQDQIDDRGVIWIRHGPPTQRAITINGEAAEVWRYAESPNDLVLQFREVDFDGTVGASTLTPSLLTAPAIVRDHVCEFEASLCPHGAWTAMPPTQRDVSEITECGVTYRGHQAAVALAATTLESEAHDPALAPEAVVRTTTEGKRQIDRGVTTDSYRLDFTHRVVPGVQVYGLQRIPNGGSRLVVAFALPGNQLQADTSAGGVSYPVSLQVMASNAQGRRIDLDTLRRFVTAKPLIAREFITGTLELPVDAGRWRVSFVVSQLDGRGAVATLDEVRAPGHTSTLSISDLVLGRIGSGAHWNSGTSDVPLNPLNTYPRGTNAEAYFQLSGTRPGVSYRTRFEFFRADDDSTRAPRFAVSADQFARESQSEVSRTLGLENLAPGRYRVKVTISGGGSETSAMAWLVVTG